MELKDFSYIWQLFALIFIYVTTDLKKASSSKGKSNKKLFKNTLISGISFLVIFLFTLTPTDIGRFLKQWNREYIVMRYGIYTYQINDLVTSLSPKIHSMFGYDSNAKVFREYYEENKDVVENILKEGTTYAQNIAKENMKNIKSAMKIDY